MAGMISGMGGTKRKRGGVPLTALTQAARASGNPSLDDDQRELVAAWLSLPKAQQRAVVEDVMRDGRMEMEPGDLEEKVEEAPAEEAPVEAPVVTDPGTATVVADGQPWNPTEQQGLE